MTKEQKFQHDIATEWFRENTPPAWLFPMKSVYYDETYDESEMPFDGEDKGDVL